jgi:hypothetical protein
MEDELEEEVADVEESILIKDILHRLFSFRRRGRGLR